MDVPVPESVLSTLRELRSELQDELTELLAKHSELQTELEALGDKIESTQRALELVEATEEQLAAQEAKYQEDEGNGPGASRQVRGLAKAADHRSRVAHMGLVSVL
jgi:peptidoglycan hydrolase CwlO-like protein